MAAGIALKALQWFVRVVQFCCAALVLAIFSYFLATLSNHALTINNHIRAVEGISGAATLYTIVGLVLLCCLAGLPFTSFIAIVLDFCFAAAFIYVAWVNRYGADSCNGFVRTPFGDGDADGRATSSTDGFTYLPSLRTACRLQTASFAVSIVAIIFFLISIIMEVVLVRHHRKEKRFGPGPKNGYTSGSGKRGGIFSRFSRRRNQNAVLVDENALPVHPTPDQARHSYNTETTAVGHGEVPATYNKYGETPYAHGAQTTGTVPAHYRYSDGVVENNPNRFV